MLSPWNKTTVSPGSINDSVLLVWWFVGWSWGWLLRLRFACQISFRDFRAWESWLNHFKDCSKVLYTTEESIDLFYKIFKTGWGGKSPWSDLQYGQNQLALFAWFLTLLWPLSRGLFPVISFATHRYLFCFVPVHQVDMATCPVFSMEWWMHCQ